LQIMDKPSVHWALPHGLQLQCSLYWSFVQGLASLLAVHVCLEFRHDSMVVVLASIGSVGQHTACVKACIAVRQEPERGGCMLN